MEKSDQELSAADRTRIQQSKQHFKVNEAYATRLREELEARDAGKTLAEWLALSESERIRIWEDVEDTKFGKNSGLTLTEFRQEKRKRIEAGENRGEFGGFPQWYRDLLAKEDPATVAVEYVRLLNGLERTRGAALKEAIEKVSQYVWHGWTGVDRTKEEARELLLEEVDRLGLRELFDEARNMYELKRILES
jgi:hypothetical protein